MPQCIFCNRTAKLTAEHIWSVWMSELFPNRIFRMTQKDDLGNILNQRKNSQIDWTIKVVCKPCNEGWMSNLESRHAKPAMIDLILGKPVSQLTPVQGMAIARFAFKTAVITDAIRRGDEPFFAQSARQHFAKTLKIPPRIQAWFAGYEPRISGRLQPFWYQVSSEAGHYFKLYVCTYSIGHLVFQLVAAQFDNSFPAISFEPRAGFEHLAIPLWPNLWNGIGWPPPSILRRRDFDAFSVRWENITLLIPEPTT
jgi:hypothetical protein